MMTPPSSDFPNKGKFRVYSSDWSQTGWANSPQYPGQMPLTFPEGWTPFECFLGGKTSK